MAALFFICPICQPSQSNRKPAPYIVTDQAQGRNTLARISSADGADIQADLQGLNPMDSNGELDGQDDPERDQQTRGQDKGRNSLSHDTVTTWNDQV